MKAKHACHLFIALLTIVVQPIWAIPGNDMDFRVSTASEGPLRPTEQNHPRQQEPAPVVEFECMEHDFGTIKFKGESRTFAFRFRNTGDAPLVFTRTEQSCTCLSVKYPRKPVMPGEEAAVEISYSPKKDLGYFNNHVKLFSNATTGSPAVLFVRGEVVK